MGYYDHLPSEWSLPHTTSVCPILPSSLTAPPQGLSVGHQGFLPSWFSCSRIRGFPNKFECVLTLLPFPFTDEYDDKQPLTSKEEEERRIAEMGRPILGEHTRLEVIIEESYEFKVRAPALPTREARPISAPRRFIASVYAVREADVISGTGSLMGEAFRAEMGFASC